MLISHGECRKCGPSQAPLQGDLVKALHLSETCRSALRLGSCPSCALTTYKWLIVVSLDRSVPRKEASLMSLSMMTLMTTSLYPRRRRKGRAVAVNRKAKRRKVERGRRRGGEGSALITVLTSTKARGFALFTNTSSSYAASLLACFRSSGV